MEERILQTERGSVGKLPKIHPRAGAGGESHQEAEYHRHPPGDLIEALFIRNLVGLDFNEIMLFQALQVNAHQKHGCQEHRHPNFQLAQELRPEHLFVPQAVKPHPVGEKTGAADEQHQNHHDYHHDETEPFLRPMNSVHSLWLLISFLHIATPLLRWTLLKKTNKQRQRPS